jgi:5-methylcytosine-specific restriction endonuclease McrA
MIERLINPEYLYLITGLGLLSLAFSKSVRNEINKRQKGRCAICGNYRYLHIHHIIPRCQNGADEIENAVGLCNECHKESDRLALVAHIYYGTGKKRTDKRKSR